MEKEGTETLKPCPARGYLKLGKFIGLLLNLLVIPIENSSVKKKKSGFMGRAEFTWLKVPLDPTAMLGIVLRKKS